MPERMAHAGGNYNSGANAGVFYLNGNNVRANSNSNIGSRPASSSHPYHDTERQYMCSYGTHAARERTKEDSSHGTQLPTD